MSSPDGIAILRFFRESCMEEMFGDWSVIWVCAYGACMSTCLLVHTWLTMLESRAVKEAHATQSHKKPLAMWYRTQWYLTPWYCSLNLKCPPQAYDLNTCVQACSADLKGIGSARWWGWASEVVSRDGNLKIILSLIPVVIMVLHNVKPPLLEAGMFSHTLPTTRDWNREPR